MAAPAAVLRLLRRCPAAPRSPMLRSIFPASSYSKATNASASSILLAHIAPPLVQPSSLVRHYATKGADVTAAADIPGTRHVNQGEHRCCYTVPNTNSDGIKSLLDNLKDMKDNKKLLQERVKNIHEMANKLLHDCRDFHAFLLKRLNDFQKFAAMSEKAQDESGSIYAVDSKFSKLLDDTKKGLDIVDSSQCLFAERVQMLGEEVEGYCNAVRRQQELERSFVKKVAKLCTAVGIGGGLLLILAKL